MSFDLVSNAVLTTLKKRWKVISTPGIVHHYHPFCRENLVLTWNREDSVDEIIYENQIIYRRVFKAWYDNVGYDLTIEYQNKALADVIWRIVKIKDDKYSLTIKLKPRLGAILPTIPRFLRWIPYYGFIHWQMKKYLDHVQKGFNFFITTGVKIKPNQFGRHRFFSQK